MESLKTQKNGSQSQYISRGDNVWKPCPDNTGGPPPCHSVEGDVDAIMSVKLIVHPYCSTMSAS